ncbi:MAG TPA: type VI secretion system-associated FHA domain protein TagH [Ramlibacter sp.]|uniref:type VI secretion system-associated FHA domain protein TagH n=1 Tax=Ramlibacter sp. TaxID=1917967 RepID=UPI002D7FB17A|nr:type VI secretion system-associated FHA domain protein TagH [Ramlibacter sp.]HET8746062.1 type VI secretion system-associated FHA domain protein TagH [Ramlibacter sp.]
MSTIPTLLLAVTGIHAAQFGSRSQKAFEGRDGSIGRSEDCDWVLSSAGVSRVHAMIRCLNGIYFIEDRSTNGMLLNGVPLVKGEPSALKHGDRLQIDTFEVAVTVQMAAPPAAAPAPSSAPTPVDIFATSPPAAADPLDAFLDFAPGPSAPLADSGADAGLIPGAGPAAALDPLSFLDAPLAPAPAAAPPATPGWNHTPGMQDHFQPPITEAQRQAPALPEDWDLTMGDFAPRQTIPAPAPTPPPAVAPVPSAPVAPPVPPVMAAPAASGALPDEVQQMLGIVVDGVMDVLRARAEIKNTFRLPVTIIQRSENNPLKFAPNADEALQKILSPPNAAFLSGPAAFDDAFDDIRCHQMAMLAGVRAAFESLLAHFSPDRLEQQADGGKRSAFAGKGKYWEKYREHFEGLVKDPDDCFRRLFGDEFARAYEEQLARLKSARRGGARR